MSPSSSPRSTRTTRCVSDFYISWKHLSICSVTLSVRRGSEQSKPAQGAGRLSLLYARARVSNAVPNVPWCPRSTSQGTRCLICRVVRVPASWKVPALFLRGRGCFRGTRGWPSARTGGRRSNDRADSHVRMTPAGLRCSYLGHRDRAPSRKSFYVDVREKSNDPNAAAVSDVPGVDAGGRLGASGVRNGAGPYVVEVSPTGSAKLGPEWRSTRPSVLSVSFPAPSSSSSFLLLLPLLPLLLPLLLRSLCLPLLLPLPLRLLPVRVLPPQC